jgi:hypothetical protein
VCLGRKYALSVCLGKSREKLLLELGDALIDQIYAVTDTSGKALKPRLNRLHLALLVVAGPMMPLAS